MLAKRTKTIETFILPEEFTDYSKLGYVIFMSKPTVFGTYRAIKIEMVAANREPEVNKTLSPNFPKIKISKSVFSFLNIINRQN